MSPAIKVGTAYVEVRGDFDNFDRDLDQQTKKSKGKFASFASAGGAAGVALKATLGGAVAGLGAQMVGLASDAEETGSKFRTVFGPQARRATRELDAFSKATGTSKFALREQAAQFQALIRPMGLTTKASASMSTGMTKLATDLASFNNTSVEEAITALQSGLVGEAEPMRKFGVQLSATRVEAYAYAKGIAKQGEELTAAQKAQASYGIILKDTKLAQGDATRTADSFANQFKRLKSQVIDGATSLGIVLLPAATKVVGIMTQFPAVIDAVKNAIGPLIERFRGIAGEGGAASGILERLRGIWASLGPLLGAIVGALSAAWERFGSVILAQVQTQLQMMAGVFQGVITVFQGVINIITGVLTGQWGQAWEGVKQVFAGIVTAIVAVMQGLWDTLGNVFKLGLLALETIVKAAAQPFIDLGKWLINRVIEGIQAMGAAISAAAGWLKNRVVEYVTNAAQAYASIGQSVIGWIVGGLRTVIDTLTGFGGWLRNRITETVGLVSTAIVGIGGDVIGWLVSGLRNAPDALSDTAKGFGAWLADRVTNAVKSAADAFKGVGGGIVDWIVEGLKGGLRKVGEFLNSVRDVLNKLPGPDISVDFTAGLAHGGLFGGKGGQAFARGGAFARTGGVVAAPITLMGEEAPRWPEFVIPTNPAYRKRAQMLAMQAAGAVGLKGGGIFGGIGDALSDFASGALDKVSDVIGAALPPMPKFPQWIAGAVKHAIENLLPWARKNKAGPVRKMQAFGDRMAAKNMPYVYGGGHGGWGEGPFDCSGFVSAIIHAAEKGWLSAPVSTDGLKGWGESGPGEEITVGVRGSTGRQAHTMIKVGDKYYESGGGGNGAHVLSGWNGSWPIQRHPAGFARGGIFGLDPAKGLGKLLTDQLGWGLAKGGSYAGTYHDGGVVLRNGMANVQAGERVLAADDIAQLVIEDGAMEWLRQFTRLEIVKRERDRGGAVAQGVAR